ncbi:MAG: hypothetical protein NVS2B9_13040 [Myxococcales bacterium]
MLVVAYSLSRDRRTSPPAAPRSDLDASATASNRDPPASESGRPPGPALPLAAPTPPAGAGDVAPVRAPSRPSPYAREFDRARKQLWPNRAAEAEVTLQQLLGHWHLDRRDRARASKMMGDARLKQNHKASALEWYRKALKLTTDPAERARIERQLQQ